MGTDDWLIAASMIMSLAYSSITTANVALGYGKHANTLPAERLAQVLLVNYIDFTLGIISFSMPKLAVAALLNRIVNPNRLQKAALWVLTGLVALVSGICIIVLFTMCDPPRALWETSLVMSGQATCRSTRILVDYAIFNGAISAFTDLYLAIYPTMVLMRLNMSTRKKIALCMALGLGSVATAMAIVKCFQLPGLSNKSDPTFVTAELVIWTCVESNVVIIASCIPTLHPLLEMILRRRALRSYGASHDQYKGSGSYNMPSNSYRSKRKGDFTINMETETGSQENILKPNSTQDIDGHPLSQIRRTDNVTVEYESRSGTAVGDGRSW